MQNVICAKYSTAAGPQQAALAVRQGNNSPNAVFFPLAKDKLQLITDFGMKRNLKHACSLIANIYTNKENSY